MIENLFRLERIKAIKSEMQTLEARANQLHATMLQHAQGSQSLLAVVGNAGVSVGLGLIAVNPIIGGAVTLLAGITALIGNKDLKDSERYKLQQIESLSKSLVDVAYKYNLLKTELNGIYLSNSAMVFLVLILSYIIFS